MGSMVVVSLKPVCHLMDRAGMATGSRKIALRLWRGRLPAGDPASLVEELYAEENRGKAEPSGTQDMIGLILSRRFPARLRRRFRGGVFPRHIESNNDPESPDGSNASSNSFRSCRGQGATIPLGSRISNPRGSAGSVGQAGTASTRSWVRTSTGSEHP